MINDFKKGENMKPQNLQQLLKVMEDMADLEMALADLYQTCSDTFPDDTHFWTAIKRQEEGHADSLRKIAALVAANPQEFAIDRTFNPAAIKTIKNGVMVHIDALKRAEISRAKMMTIARDIEGSLIEANYSKLVKTNNVQFMDVISRIDNETTAHKNLMIKKIASIEVR
ncbi:MAG: hypothetical protein IH604_18515 [Burkholderiales bacterium]|nr:hypothetical protein [Burkholderiales bacterium]